MKTNNFSKIIITSETKQSIFQKLNYFYIRNQVIIFFKISKQHSYAGKAVLKKLITIQIL